MSDRTDDGREGDPSEREPEPEGDPFEYPAAEGRDDGDGETGDSPEGLVEWVRWFRTTDDGAAVYLRDIVTSVAAVLLVGAVLFGISGIWPPMVAVESGSMEPNMERGDLIFIVDNERFTPDEAISNDGSTTGVVPADVAAEHDRTKFSDHGDVIIFLPNGEHPIQVIHRAMLWVEDGENWYDRADPDAIGGAEDCDELEACPAPNGGFITKGDDNGDYDQVNQLSDPVKPEWITGTAEVRIPYLGHIRLTFAGQPAPPLTESVGATNATSAGPQTA